MTDASPRPWKITPDNESIRDCNGRYIAAANKPNRECIVRSVNAAEDLASMVHCLLPCCPSKALYEEARAALAKWENENATTN